jgi:serralysin
MNGGAGDDVLNGGDGGDFFVFVDLGGHDQIADFKRGQDRIDVSGIDAIAGGADDAFVWIGSSAFTGVAGQLHVISSSGHFFVEGDVNGDGLADFSIQTHVQVNNTDFIL